ncbi:precorrin-4 C(11)-methyltransferase [Desulfolutivibrio sulfoxidireducens]|uniref:precorrin-4 C(11)-methyltransferase n=1 Tax=Desulfolutivibrio sulfoxidireducens TaxID=2773299 RepID=UPI00159E2E63|nr:precorrin-4 C(11)-methyltransferase [Desulfolutivibrio sulfoxidireducens]QLA21216.1 precorrin-4 C(11)-methyltransferase [Desulfolutivibrio sulfoxidireducens]
MTNENRQKFSGREGSGGNPLLQKGVPSRFPPSSPSSPRVFFIGAGPGDPGLLTVKAARVIGEAGLVLYAGSLVPREVVAGAREGARVLDSSSMTLEETHGLLVEAARGGETAARVHTGDPGLYGAVAEQARLLERDGVPYEIVPGVTTASAAAAALGVSFTMPEATQTLLLTRLSGRTPVPDTERLRDLAAHKTSLAIYLSAGDPEGLRRELLAAGLPPDTPVGVAYRLGWPDEKLFWTTVDALPDRVRDENTTRQTIFLILPHLLADPARSKLYDPAFSHGFRT